MPVFGVDPLLIATTFQDGGLSVKNKKQKPKSLCDCLLLRSRSKMLNHCHNYFQSRNDPGICLNECQNWRGFKAKWKTTSQKSKYIVKRQIGSNFILFSLAAFINQRAHCFQISYVGQIFLQCNDSTTNQYKWPMTYTLSSWLWGWLLYFRTP